MDILSLGFSDNVLRVLKVNPSKEIIFKDEINLGFNINDDLHIKQDKDELMIEFAEKIADVLKDENNEVKTAGIIIDTSQTFLNVIPMDFNEDQNSINSHILWELSNYFPETYKNFNIKYYRLNNNNLNKDIDEVLIIAVDKNRLDFIKKLCNNNNIKIKNIEIDQFIVEKCLKEIYPDEINSKNILVIGCKNYRIDFSLIVKGKIKYYDYDHIDQTNFNVLVVKQMNFFNSIFSDLNIEKVFLYGDGNLSLVKKFLNNEYGTMFVSFINPFDLENDQNNLSKYAPLYGLALKNLS